VKSEEAQVPVITWIWPRPGEFGESACQGDGVRNIPSARFSDLALVGNGLIDGLWVDASWGLLAKPSGELVTPRHRMLSVALLPVWRHNATPLPEKYLKTMPTRRRWVRRRPTGESDLRRKFVEKCERLKQIDGAAAMRPTEDQSASSCCNGRRRRQTK
jgi:hypothetical protein